MGKNTFWTGDRLGKSVLGLAVLTAGSILPQYAQAQATSFGSRPSEIANLCSDSMYNTFQLDGDGDTTFDGLRITTTSSASTGVSWSNLMSAYSINTANFLGSEYSVINGPIGRNGFRYENAELGGLDDVITQNFFNDTVYELLYHINSLDQFGFWFDPSENTNVG